MAYLAKLVGGPWAERELAMHKTPPPVLPLPVWPEPDRDGPPYDRAMYYLYPTDYPSGRHYYRYSHTHEV